MNGKVRDMIVTNAVAILAGLLVSGLMLLMPVSYTHLVRTRMEMLV